MGRKNRTRCDPAGSRIPGMEGAGSQGEQGGESPVLSFFPVCGLPAMP